MQRRQMRLGVFVQTPGHHVAGWRHPDAVAGGPNLELMKHIAATAERGKFDMFFLGDGFATGYGEHPSTIGKFEPISLLSALAMSTSRVGLAATASTTYAEPYHVARSFASLDHLSGGRAGWNVVTTAYAKSGAVFGRQHPPHAERYAMAEEFVEACRLLWDSWDDDAFIADKATGRFVRPGSLQVPDFRGKYFAVEGGLNVPRPPQGHPVLIQAGSSGPGQALAARIADVVFTAQNDRTEAQAFYKGLKAQLVQYGRPADSALVMPGVFPVIGRTEAEAQAIFAELNRNIDTAQAFTVLSDRLGTDMSVYPLDGPVPALPETEHLKSRAALLLEMARREKLSLRQLFYRVAAARGHLLLIGNPVQIADVLESWFRSGAADGFNVMPPFFPGQFDDFVDGVVPLLQERGLFRADYEGSTLREHLGLQRPASVAHPELCWGVGLISFLFRQRRLVSFSCETTGASRNDRHLRDLRLRLRPSVAEDIALVAPPSRRRRAPKATSIRLAAAGRQADHTVLLRLVVNLWMRDVRRGKSQQSRSKFPANQASPLYTYIKVEEQQGVAANNCSGGKILWPLAFLKSNGGTPSMAAAPNEVGCAAAWTNYGSATLPADWRYR